MFIISGTLGGTRFVDDDIWLRFIGLSFHPRFSLNSFIDYKFRMQTNTNKIMILNNITHHRLNQRLTLVDI